MADLGQAQTGTLRSTPKICTLKGDDNMTMIYKSMGNGHVVPVVWSDTVTLVSGTSVTVASGVVIHGMDLATYANVVATPLRAVGTTTYYVEKDKVNNVITIKSSATLTNTSFDVMCMLGYNTPNLSNTYKDIDIVNKNVPAIGH